MARPKKQAENEVKKHSAAIQIEGKITLLQRKTWNVLLWHAYNDLVVRDIHEISILEAMRLVGFESHNDGYFKSALEALAGCRVKWNIFDKANGSEWGFAVLLASATVKNGVCSYGFAPHLRQKLYNPDMYARINLNLQKRFGSKYSLALWELCTDTLGGKREAGETRWIAVEDFRQLMGIEGKIYDSFKRITSKVLSPALAEVNRVSDFRVTAEYQRQGRKVTALKFKICRVAMLPEPVLVQSSLFPDEEDKPVVVKALGDAGLSAKEALEIWQAGFSWVEESVRPSPPSGEDADAAFYRYVQEKIHLLKRRQAVGKIENSTGFLLNAIKKNYANPEFADAEKSRTAAKKHREKLRRQAERQRLEDEKAVVQRACDAALDDLCKELVETSPDLVRDILPGILAEQPSLRQFLSGQDVVQNYQDSPLLRGAFNPHLERTAPERFHAVRAEYKTHIAALDEQIAAL